MRKILLDALFLVGLLALAQRAEAHPHVFVDGKAELVFDKSGQITAVRNIWKFDKAFAAFATEGLDANHDGKFSEAELKPLAKTNVESLADYDYFTSLTVEGKKIPFLPPTEYHLEFTGGNLTLFFTLPLKTPLPSKGTASLAIYDREYFVAFTFEKATAIKLDGAPAACKAVFKPPRQLDTSIMLALSGIPIDQHDLPPDLEAVTLSLANSFQLTCP